MLILSVIVLIVTLLVHYLHRVANVYVYWMDAHGSHEAVQLSFITDICLIVPILIFLATVSVYKIDKEHRAIPLLHTLTLTFSSMCMIAGGEGMVEDHFSIFMVVAILGYYE